MRAKIFAVLTLLVFITMTSGVVVIAQEPSPLVEAKGEGLLHFTMPEGSLQQMTTLQERNVAVVGHIGGLTRLWLCRVTMPTSVSDLV